MSICGVKGYSTLIIPCILDTGYGQSPISEKPHGPKHPRGSMKEFVFESVKKIVEKEKSFKVRECFI